MRIRTIKPDFFVNEKIADLPALTRLFFIGLWCMSDVEGRCEERKRQMKAKILPYDDADIEEILAQLASAGRIIRYKSGDIQLVQVVGFTKHQRINGREADGKSEYPAPGKTRNSVELRGIPRARALEGKGREGKGTVPAGAEFIADIRKMDVYRGLNIDVEFGKMEAWLSLHPARRLTKRFAINWLNKAVNDNQVISIPAEPVRQPVPFAPEAFEPLDLRAQLRRITEEQERKLAGESP